MKKYLCLALALVLTVFALTGCRRKKNEVTQPTTVPPTTMAPTTRPTTAPTTAPTPEATTAPTSVPTTPTTTEPATAPTTPPDTEPPAETSAPTTEPAEENTHAAPAASLPEDEIPLHTLGFQANFAPTNEINTTDNTTQPIIKQRKVSKIIVLFDDGSFQEM